MEHKFLEKYKEIIFFLSKKDAIFLHKAG